MVRSHKKSFEESTKGPRRLLLLVTSVPEMTK